MAWRSSGSSNDELVDNLKRFGVIHQHPVEQAFRSVDRRFFVPPSEFDEAHSDQPLRDGTIHISAPHIYGSVVEALNVEPAMSFLNIGSGTGYLSAIVGHILGPTGSSFGVEIHQENVDHCIASMQRWEESQQGKHEQPFTQFIHGNGLQIDASKGEAALGFDRIYVGASIDNKQLKKIVGLLRIGGILVGPVEDELIKVVRIRKPSSPQEQTTGLFRQESHELSDDFSKELISGVLFAPLVKRPSRPIVLKSRVWSPSVHQTFPDSFRMSCKELLLCTTAPTDQTPVRPKPPINLASLLPKPIWLEILSYTHRDWFENQSTDAVVLRRHVQTLESSLQMTQEEHRETRRKLRLAEREAERFKALASQFESRLQEIIEQKKGDADDVLLQQAELGSLVLVSARGDRNNDMDEEEEEQDDDSEDDSDSLSLDSDDEDETTSLMDFSVTDIPAMQQARRVSIAEDD